MGCCHPEKKPEENEILSFFNKMEREHKFNFTIEKYEENYEIIINLSSNSFKKLKKKQQVRIGFVSEIMKNINKIYIEEKEEKITKKIIFYILILSLTLDNYLKERKEANMTNNNDLEQFLLTIIIKILNKPFKDFQNMKIVLYYLANMLVILFTELKDINHYFNIEKYIDLIYKVTEEENALDNNEIYPFIKVNLICLGKCFLSNYPQIRLGRKSIHILIKYYVEAYFFNFSFLNENFTIFNKYLFFYNINYNNNNINKTINNNNINKVLVNDMIYKNNNFLTISNIKTYTNINDISNSLNQSKIINNNYKTSYISNMDDLSFNNNNFLEIIKTRDFEDIQQISFSLYSFLKTTTQDTLSGKKIFKFLGDIIEEKLKDNTNSSIIIKKSSFKPRNSNCSINPENYFSKNIYKIIYLFLVNKCKIENDNMIVISLLYYISDIIKEEKQKEQYYDILLQLFFLFNNEQIRQIIINLLSHTFIKDVENKNSFDFIEDMFGVAQMNSFNSFGSNKMKIIKHFLINISQNIKEIQNINLKIKILIKLTDILDKYIKIYNKNSNEFLPSNDIPSSDNQIKYKIDKDRLINMFKNFEFDNENFDDDNNNNLYYFFFINYMKFFIIFSKFMSYNFICEGIFKDLAIRKRTFHKLINYITQLEILSIQGEIGYVNDIISLIKIILKIIEKYSIECFGDFRILCSFFGESLLKLSNISNKHKIIDFHILKLSYTVLIFILIQLKKIFRLPTSIIKIHKGIIDCIKNLNTDISKHLDEINMEMYLNSKLNKKMYQDLKKYLKTEIKLEIEPKILRQAIDIIYSKLFGKTSFLFIFLESQNYKISSNIGGKNSDIIEITEETINSFQTINYQNNMVNDITLKLADDKDSAISIKKNEEDSQKLNLPKIPEDNNDTLINRKNMTSSDLELTDKIKI